MAQLIHVPPAGARRAKVTVEERMQSTDGGFPIDVWVPLMTLWMQKIDLLGREAFQAEQMTARYDVRFLGPYARALDPEVVDVPATQRLRYRGQNYDITGAAVVGNFEGVQYFAMTSTQSDGV